jgi:hypothetical protein
MFILFSVITYRGGFIPFLIVLLIHVRFFPPRRFRGEATGLHPIQRKAGSKVAGNREETEWWGR